MDHHAAVIDTTWLDRMRDNDEEGISSEVTSTDSATIQCLDDSDAENEDFSEVNENKKHIVDMDTMLDNYDPTVPTCDELLSPQEITFAPGEGQVPLSVFNDDNAEYLSFPTFFLWKKRPDNREQFVNVHYSDIWKYELCCVDRSAARNVPNLF